MRPRVLVVDDEPDIVRVLDFALKQAGFETEAAADASTALQRVKDRPPDASGKVAAASSRSPPGSAAIAPESRKPVPAGGSIWPSACHAAPVHRSIANE